MNGVTRVSAAVLAVMVLVVGCTAPQQDDTLAPDGAVAVPDEPEDDDGPRPGGTLRIGLSSEPASLDPRFVIDGASELLVDALFDPLVRVEPDGEVVGAAAARWEIDESGREFRFHLRKANFHDGTPVTAGDFKRSFDRIANGTAEPASFLAYLLEPVEGSASAQRHGVRLTGVEAVDERTLVIRLSEPDPGYLTTLSNPSLVPLPEVADHDLDDYANQPVGNGPFAMTGPREPGSFVRLTRFADHHDPPLLEEVVFTIYSEAGGQQRQYEDLLEGQLHVADLAPEQREAAVEEFGRSPDGYSGPGVIEGINATVYLYGIDTTVAPFDDVRVRQALSLAIDREALADDVMQGTREPATGIVPPSIPGGRLGACTNCRHDPEAAAVLWAEVQAEAAGQGPEDGSDPEAEGRDASGDADDAQGPDDGASEGGDSDAAEADGDAERDAEGAAAVDGDGGGAENGEDVAPVLERLILTHTRGNTHTAIAERMASDIESALDLDVDFQARDLQTFVQSVREGEVEMFRLGWQVSTLDAGAYLRPLFHSSEVGTDNLSRYASDEVDALLDEAQAAREPGARLDAFRVAERRILQDMPVIPLLWHRHSVVVARDVEDLVYSPLGRFNLADVWFATPAA